MRKVNSTLREVLADELERLTDPRLEMVSVTAVDTSPDLRTAMVFVSTLDLDRADDAVLALQGAAPRLQQALGRQVRMKFTPALSFALDSGIVGGERIDEILRTLEHDGPEADHAEGDPQPESEEE